MKKIFLLFASALLSLGAMANVEFTFTRGANNAATVAVTPAGTATMASNVNWNSGGAMANRTEVLCPNRNTSQASGDNFITFTLSVSGLTAGQSFTAAKFTHIAVNSGGNLQPSNNTDVRHCNFTLTANGTEVASLTDQNIWIPAGSSDKVITLEGTSFAADAEGSLVIVLKISKGTSNNGCFYGLTKVELVEASAEPEPEPSVEHTFSADKVYYIQWKNTGANYITENRDKSLMVADKKNSKYQFWKLIPVEGKSHCYYIQNVVTENYLGSCNMTPSSSSRVSTSANAVEYYIGATAGGGNIAGCHYFSSTDCANYNNESAGPRALNKDGASSYIITWTAGLQDGSTTNYKEGSYWKIVETTDEYQAPEPPAHTEQTKNLVVYFRPCGMVSNTYLTAATIDGVDPVSYTATAAPSSFHVPYSKDHGAVMPGSTFNVNITLNNSNDADLKANAYFDWNADGEFESTQAITLNGTTGTAEVTVPEGAVSGDTRMRIRLNSNGLDRADDDVEGFVYDIPFAVVGAGRKVFVDVNGADRGTATLSTNDETYAVGTQLTATATPKGNATFDSWREGGVVVSREATYTFAVENRNMTLKAYFTPNTESEAIPAQWDITFTRTSTTEATATVTSKGAPVEGVTATIAIAGGSYQNADQTASNKGILCINRNTTAATADDPNAYTLTITNNSSTTYTFDYAAVAGVALNSNGGFQPLNTMRQRNFKVTLGETTLPAECLTINDNNHCNGKETFHAFGQPITVPAGGSYVVKVDIYTDGGAGCFYGLTRIALGNTTVAIGSTGYTTLYTPIAMTVPENVKFYKGDLSDDNTLLTLTAIGAGTAIPHETAVIVEGEPNSEFSYKIAARNSGSVSNNDLEGTHASVATSTVNVDNNEAYTLQTHDYDGDGTKEGIAFKRYTGTNLVAGKAYLMLPESFAAQQQAVRIRFEGSTDIEAPEFTIQNSEFIYDLMGRRVERMVKSGIYIVNGKKVVIK